MRVDVAWKWAGERVEVDPWTGAVRIADATRTVSAADRAALAIARSIAVVVGGTTRVLTVGPSGADAVLRTALRSGADEVLRLDLGGSASSRSVAHALAGATSSACAVVFGTHSLDRASATVPPLVAALSGRAAVCGVVEIGSIEPDGVVLTRRLDAGWREQVRVALPAVISVEGAVARPSRASLASVVAAGAAAIPVERVRPPSERPPAVTSPYVPRALEVAPPGGGDDDVLVRLRGLLGGTPSRRGDPLDLDPETAARRILTAIDDWEGAR